MRKFGKRFLIFQIPIFQLKKLNPGVNPRFARYQQSLPTKLEITDETEGRTRRKSGASVVQKVSAGATGGQGFPDFDIPTCGGSPLKVQDHPPPAGCPPVTGSLLHPAITLSKPGNVEDDIDEASILVYIFYLVYSSG